MTDDPWWVCISNTNCERRATQGLVDKGFEVWRPSYLTTVWVGGRKTARRREEREVFPAPGYLFARHDNSLAWPEMIGVQGLREVRCSSEFVPFAVPSREVERWRRFLEFPDEMGIVEDAYRIGDQVRIVEGPFAQFQGVVDRYIAGKGVWVSVSMFGRATALRMADGMLEQVS